MNELIQPRAIGDNQLEDAIILCTLLYEHLRGIGIYPALTGGCLYKQGNRKDIDIVLYMDNSNLRELEDIEGKLKAVGLENFKHFGYVTKCLWNGYTVDILLPQTLKDDDYDEEERGLKGLRG